MSAVLLPLRYAAPAAARTTETPQHAPRVRTDVTTQRPAFRVIEPYHLSGTVGHGFEIVQPLPLNVERDAEGVYLISDSLFGVYGQGPTLDEAFADYSVSLVEYHDIMAAGVNPETKAIVEHLRTYLQAESR